MPVRTVIVGKERPPELEAWLERRRALGQDAYDEVWEGEYHVAPMAHGRQGDLQYKLSVLLGPPAEDAGLHPSGPVNIGGEDDYRVPDLAFRRQGQSTAVWNPSAAIVVEIVSPGDESRHKFGFYFDHGVDEVVIVDPELRSVEWFGRVGRGFEPVAASALLGLRAAEVASRLDWPA